MKRRRVVKRQPTSQSKLSWKERLKPANLKAFIFSRQGAVFFAKAVGAGLLLIFLVLLYYAKDLPSPNKINSLINAQTTKFYDRTGKTELYEVHGNENRTVLEFNQIPQNMKDATLAVEDKNFYHEGAFSTIGILRAAFVDLFCHCGIQGGSTITQQYVKNALLTDNRTVSRKIKELILSIEINAFYSKDDILKLYLNEIPYGSNAYGVEAACKTYFPYHTGSNSSQLCAPSLTLEEAALLASMPQAPTYYSPYVGDRSALISRQHLILDLMAQQHYITQAQADAAKQVDVLSKIPAQQNLYANIIAPHFVLNVEQELEAKYGISTVTEGGWKVITTLDLNQQREAEQAVNDNMAHIHSAGGSNAAVVSADPTTGQILSMVGSYSFSVSQFNVATAERQPGSSFKPFVYATSWGQGSSCEAPSGCGPGTTMYNVTTDFGGGYKPQNFPGDPANNVETMRASLGNSLNIPAVKALYMAGIQNSITTAQKMGITTLNQPADDYGLSLVLGSGDVKLVDMVNAYESFANLGIHYQPTDVLKITDSKGNTVQQWQPPKLPERVLDPQVAYLMDNVLSDINAKRPAFNIDLRYFTFPGHTVAAKTGTTEHFQDAWTMGYTPSLVAGVWVGNNDNSSMTLQAADVAAPLWHEFMTSALANTPNQTWQQPAGIKQVTLDAYTGRLPAQGTHDPQTTDIFPSWYKPPAATDTTSAQVDKLPDSSGQLQLATQCTPPLAVETVYSSAIHAEIPSTDPAYSRWEPPVEALAHSLGFNESGGGNLPTKSDDVHSCSDTKPTVNIHVTPNGDGSYQVSADWKSGTFTINDVKLQFNDTVISDNPSPQASCTGCVLDSSFTPSGDGTLRAVVTDSGLYQAEDDYTVSGGSGGGGGGSGFENLSPSNGALVNNNGSINFKWSPDNVSGASYVVYVVNTSTQHETSYSAGSNTTEAVNLPPGIYQWWVVDQADNRQTSTWQFTKS